MICALLQSGPSGKVEVYDYEYEQAYHSIVLYLFISIVLLMARAFQKRSRPQQLTLCQSLHAKALQATASEGLA